MDLHRNSAAVATALALAGICGSIRAQELPTIVVTARHREENSQDVPISISTVSGRQLELAHSYLAAEWVQPLPNVQLQFVNPRQTAFVVRGLGNNPASEGLETSVGLYLDGVYISRPGMLISDFNDIEQIEVLRGSQGTLFGRNTTAGALVIRTRKPERSFKSSLELSAGRFDLAQLMASITGPLSSTLAGRLSVFYTGRDGTIENLRNGADLNNLRKVGARGQLYFEPSDAFNVRLITDFAHQQEDSGAQVLIDPGLTLADGNTRPNNLLIRTARFGYTPAFEPFARQVDFDRRSAIETTNDGASLEANWNLAGYTLTSISAWRRWQFQPRNDMDFLPLDILHNSGSNLWNRQLSEEIRIASPTHRDIDFVAGVFLYGQRIEAATVPGATYGVDAAKFFSQPGLILPAYALEGLTSDTRADVTTSSYAAFGEATWHLDERWDLTAGARFSWDDKEAVVSRTRSGGSVLSPSDSFFAPATAARNQLAPANATANNKSSGETFSGSLSLTYQPADAYLLYGSLSRGVKAAGLNTSILPPGVDPTLEPEIAMNAELGVKATLHDQRLQLNGDLFWTNIDNYQTTIRDRVLLATYLANAEAARTRGAEIEVRWAALDGLQLDAAVGYDEAIYTAFHNAPCGIEWSGIATSCDLTGRAIAGAPRWSGHVRGEYSRGLGRNLRGSGGIEYTYRSGSYYSPDDSTYSRIDAYGLAELDVNIGPASGRWELSVWARNLFNEEYLASISTGGGFAAGYVAGVVGDPRTFGATLRLQF